MPFLKIKVKVKYLFFLFLQFQKVGRYLHNKEEKIKVFLVLLLFSSFFLLLQNMSVVHGVQISSTCPQLTTDSDTVFREESIGEGFKIVTVPFLRKSCEKKFGSSLTAILNNAHSYLFCKIKIVDQSSLLSIYKFCWKTHCFRIMFKRFAKIFMYNLPKKDVDGFFFTDNFFQKQFWGKRWYIKVV